MTQGWLWFYWPFALLFIALVLFAIPEYISIRHRSAGPTFSFFMYTLSVRWPLWTFFWGMLIGGLAVHFLWHWCPDATSIGSLCNPAHWAAATYSHPIGTVDLRWVAQ